MNGDITITPLHQPGSVEDPLTDIARDGARRMLAAALCAEADAFVARHAEQTLPDGRQRVVRHGYGPERSVQTGIGALDMRRPKVRDRAADVPAENRIRAGAEAAMDTFARIYGVKYEKAVTCLIKEREALLAFCDFPAKHWDHLRTGNPIESVFATFRHRTVRTKGALSQKTAKLMVFKLVHAAAKTWRRLKGANQSPQVIEGVTFTDGVPVSDAESRAA